MVKPYYHIKFNWGEAINLEKIENELSERFMVSLKKNPRDPLELSIHKDDRDELIVSADTLSARLTRYMAVLYQKKYSKFTLNDVDLRLKIHEIYAHDRPTPLPLFITTNEPKYEQE